MKAFLPVAESFGFTAFLREKTGGKAFPNCVFDHWEVLEGDALDPENKLGKIVVQHLQIYMCTSDAVIGTGEAQECSEIRNTRHFDFVYVYLRS